MMMTRSRFAARAALVALLTTACTTPIVGSDVGNVGVDARVALADAPGVDAHMPGVDAPLLGTDAPGCMPGVFGTSRFGAACFQ